jgi:hypothetical protein
MRNTHITAAVPRWALTTQTVRREHSRVQPAGDDHRATGEPGIDHMRMSARHRPNDNDRWSKYLVRACAAGFVVVLAGCGNSSAATTAPATIKATSSPVAAPSPAFLPQLNAIVLRPTDLPKGWLGTPHKVDPNAAANNAAMAKCVGGRDTNNDQVAEANSADFALARASISSAANSYRSTSDISSDIAILHSPKVSTCLEQQLVKQLATSLPKGATIESASIKITPGSAGGPANVVANGTGSIKVSLNSQQAAMYKTVASTTSPLIYLTVAFITGPLLEAEVDTTSIGTPLPASLVKSLVADVATRAAKG